MKGILTPVASNAQLGKTHEPSTAAPCISKSSLDGRTVTCPRERGLVERCGCNYYSFHIPMTLIGREFIHPKGFRLI
jgi:hypothetical protein